MFIAFTAFAVIVSSIGCAQPAGTGRPNPAKSLVELPLVLRGTLLSGSQAVPGATGNSTEPVFSHDTVDTIGVEPGYNDAAHQMVTFRISVTNKSAEAVKDVRVTLSTTATNKPDPQLIQAEPENTAHHDFAPGESETYIASWRLDASQISKPEIAQRVEGTSVIISFTTQDGQRAIQSLSQGTH